ncbi:ABC-transporter-regulating transcription factor [Exophiala dermatitidis]
MDHQGNMESLGFDMPQFASQSTPQMFGGYTVDGTSLNGGISSTNYFDFNDGVGDDNDPKRRRIARACDMCRKKKIKCDGKMPKCGHCINYKTECVFTQVEKKRNPPKGAKYIEGLENRLGRMESLLRMSGLLSEDETGKTDLGTLEKRLAEKASSNQASRRRTDSPAPPRSGAASTMPENSPQAGSLRDSHDTPAESFTSPSADGDRGGQDDVGNLSEAMCSLVTNNVGETRYIGSSSAFSIFSSKGIEWVNEKTGDTSFQETIQNAVSEDDLRWQSWKPEIFGDIYVRRVFKPLPPKEEALSLFKDFFENFNCMFPLFHEPTFMHLVEKQYSKDPYEGSGWWASINVALAIAYRIRVMSNVVPHEDDQKAWLYLKNAMGVIAELTMRNTDLLSVQALLGMALFLQGTPNPQPSFFLIAAAIRCSHAIGLHKRGSAFNLNPIEVEQRKRVFWIAYLLDKDACLRSGRPPAQDDDDMNVDLPSEDPPDNIGNVPLADGKGKINLFRLMCEFAIISSRVYRQLYSVRASKQSDGELLNTIGELDKELEAWKDSIPIDFRPEHEIKTSHTPLILHIVVLHFSYYNCLTTIHRMSVHHGYWTSRLSDFAIQGLNARPLNPRVFSSAALCVSAARASIHLIKYIPQGDFACVWLIIYFPVSALVTIFANILQNPQDTRAKADIKLMDLVVNFLSNVSNEESSGSLKRILTICSEFARIARVVIEKAEKEGSKRKRRLVPEEVVRVNQSAMAQAQAHINGRRPSGSRRSSGVAGGSPRDPGTVPPTTGMPNNTSTNATTNNSMGPNATFFSLPSQDNDYADILNQNGASPDLGQQTMPSATMSPLNVGSFQHPFVPQDLWQMPMTFEWDWADFGQSTGSDFIFSDGLNDGMQNMPHQQ